MLKFLNIPIFDSDREVKKILEGNTLVIDKIQGIWPDVVFLEMEKKKINKFYLGDKIFKNKKNRKLLEKINIASELEPLRDSISCLRSELPKNLSLIGFAGAPWTLACYMIEGKGSKDFIKTRKAVWSEKKWFLELLETLILYISQKLEMQAKAGADILMIFDSWSHMIPNNFFDECAIKPISKIIRILRSRDIPVPIIGFPFKAGSSIVKYSFESEVDCIALDWSVDMYWANSYINKDIAIQGNLDPASLVPIDSKYLKKNVLSILDKMSDRRFIFNVGHGLTPDCKIDNVKKVIDIVRKYNG